MLFVAIPCASSKAYTGHVLSLLSLDRICRERGVEMEVRYENGISLVHHARNKLVAQFLATTHEYMLFLDDDVEFEAGAIMDMIDTKTQVIGAIYPYKNYYWQDIANAARNGLSGVDMRLAGIRYTFTNTPENIQLPVGKFPLEVEGVGTGCLLIHRSVFQKMLDHNVAKYEHNDQIFHRFFDVSLCEGRLVSEDYWFCDKWRQLGGTVYVATWARCQHWGNHRYGG